ncbi:MULTISPECIES: CheW domain-containing protein [Pseudomonas]|uniref:CheW domain-containing protein n=1 Tax=Pseudomonas weihenstephanensis TaxID=1608994 RepID=A0ABS1ZEG2_9PSED|nr:MULTISPECIES: CheW domain-containing protein [Pseudomonas]KVV05330.1 CheW-like domain protein [Pseudomonas sp. TAD18]KVV06999.1 CheW-like domain protein [Pseudomonas sp. TAA207]MBM1194850.1 CheW domain-containing protein [Pseudomonas weihenstephanensis]
MKQPVLIPTRPQLALQSYLDGLLQEATEELLAAEPEPVMPLLMPEVETVALDDFAAAVLEEQVRDAAVPAPAPAVVVPIRAPAALAVELPEGVQVEQALARPLVDVHLPTAPGGRLPALSDGRPAWAAEPFECLLFDVAGLTLAVPLVCLGSIYSLAGRELTPLFGQPEWFLGILPSQSGNLKVLDTARWVMPDRYRDDFREGLQYVISVQGYEWGLAVHQVSRSLRLDPNEIKWRTQRGQRPWLAGTVIEHMCALLDVAELAELIASGAVKHMAKAVPAPQA